MKYSLFKNISFIAFLLLVFSACGPDNLDITDLDNGEIDPDVVICNMIVSIEESTQGPLHLYPVIEDGNPPYTYLWSTGETSEIVSLTTPVPGGTGLYTLEVTDSEGCVATDTLELGSPCFGFSCIIEEQPPGSGNLVCTVNGGSGPYTYVWSSNGTIFQSGDQDNYEVNADGTYFVTVMDSEDCFVTGVIEVGNNNDPCAQFNAEIIEDPVGSGMLEADAIAGTAPYTYSWSNGATGAIIEAFFDGSYSVTITDANGCYAIDSYEVVLGANPCQNFSVTLAEQPPGSGAIFSSVTGGTAPYEYLWSTGDTTPNIQVNALGTYTLTVSDAAGCVLAVIIEI